MAERGREREKGVVGYTVREIEREKERERLREGERKREREREGGDVLSSTPVPLALGLLDVSVTAVTDYRLRNLFPPKQPMLIGP